MERSISVKKQYKYVQDTIARGDVDLLVILWAEAAYGGEVGKQTREQITDALPTLAQELGVPSSKTFREFVEAYDKKNYDAQCKQRPSECLRFFARRGDRRNIRLCIKYNNSNLNWNKGLAGAARGGHADLVEFFLVKGARLFEPAFLAAVRGGNEDLVQFFTKKGAGDPYKGLAAAIEGNHLRLIDFFLAQDLVYFDEVLEIAARRGNWKLVHLFIEKGARNWGWALRGAARAGHLDMIEFFLAKGAKLSWGFSGAARAGRRDIMDLFIAKGFKDIYMGLGSAVQGQHVETVKFILTEGIDNAYVAFLDAVRLGNVEIVNLVMENAYSVLDRDNVWPEAMQEAAIGGHLNLVKYFVNEFKLDHWERGLQAAAKGGYLDLILYFIGEGAKKWDRALKAAYEAGEDWLIPFFLDKGADDWNEMMAMWINDDKLFDYAISQGADDWDLGLYHAAQAGNMTRIKYFLAQGADPAEGLEGASGMKNRELTAFFRALVNGDREEEEL